MIIHVHAYCVSRWSSSWSTGEWLFRELHKHISTIFMRSLTAILRTSGHYFTISMPSRSEQQRDVSLDAFLKCVKD
ncbi:hypothetical protein P692DRAFT_20895427 [Suillus brevipes Sb2]|nr:hypothetical protein P692DRAFT_20895427 [Suillus brevipes Sb2]